MYFYSVVVGGGGGLLVWFVLCYLVFRWNSFLCIDCQVVKCLFVSFRVPL